MILQALRKTFLFALAWGVILAGFYLIVWRPQMREIDKLERMIDLNRKSLKMIGDYLQRSPKLSEEMLDEAERALKAFLARIPSDEDVPDVLRRVRSSGGKHGLDITFLREATGRKTEKPPGEYLKSTYKLGARGRFRDVMRFLADLESCERLISIETFSIRRDSSEPWRVNLDLEFSVFYSPLPEVSGGAEGG
ncbi:hypothetical protein DRP77_03575 [Candidatus Poribacteria bacterium]|nr:MAG: hypothetical protein DRP77_03575 [Candidatus Poribacteria bacterium]